MTPTIERAYLECIADLAEAVGELNKVGVFCADLETRVYWHLSTYEDVA